MKKLKAIAVVILCGILSTTFFVRSTAATVPGTVDRITLDSSGTQANNNSQAPVLSGDGRYVAFESAATNLVSGDTNGYSDVFVRDRTNNTTARVSVSSAGAEGNAGGGRARISYGGRYVVFESYSSNLVSGDTNNDSDIFIRDLQNNTTTLVSSSSAGTIANAASIYADVSADGRFVVFSSTATNLVAGVPSSPNFQIYIKDMVNGNTKLLSRTATGYIGNDRSFTPSISCDGGIVSFESRATDLVTNDTNGHEDIFTVVRAGGSDDLADITLAANNDSNIPRVSCNGNQIIFISPATNLTLSDTNGYSDTFVYDRLTQSYVNASVSTSGSQANSYSNYPAISDDGRYITFQTDANNLGSSGGNTHIYVRDLKDQTTELLSQNSSHTVENGSSETPTISPDGKYVTFVSTASNLVSSDTNSVSDVFTAQTGY